MPRSSPIQSVFHGGELSQDAQGRIDLPIYKKSLATCLNWIPLAQGPLTRRPGTQFVSLTKSQTSYSRLIPFYVSATEAYMIEIGIGTGAGGVFARVWNSNGSRGNGGVDLSFGIPVFTTSTQIQQIRYIQANRYLQANGNYLILVHPKFPPWVISGFTPNGGGLITSFSASQMTFIDGPYIDIDVNVTQATGSATGLTCNNTAGINGGTGFNANDVGRLIRVYFTVTNTFVCTPVTPWSQSAGTPGGAPSSSAWYKLGKQSAQYSLQTAPGTSQAVSSQVVAWGTITAVNSTTSVNVTWNTSYGGSTLPNGKASDHFALGLFSANSGYPSCVALHEGRLCFGGVLGQHLRIDMSTSFSLNQFSPTDLSTVIADDSMAVEATLLSDDANQAIWMKSHEKGLLAGTEKDEHLVTSSSGGPGITPTSIEAHTVTAYGAGTADPVKVGRNILFAQRYGKKVREMMFNFYVGGFTAQDRTLYADHICGGSAIGTGVLEMGYQKGPISVVWVVKQDGTLVAMTHEDENGDIITGWHRHQMGFPTFPNASPVIGAAVESVAIIPDTFSNSDVVWLEVARTGAGGTTRTIEMMTPVFDQFMTISQSWFLDCATSFTGPATVFASTNLAPWIGMVVSLFGDGKYIGTARVASAAGGTQGSVTYPQTVTSAVVGFPYNSDLQLLRQESGSADGGALMKLKKTHRLGILSFNTLALMIGNAFTNLTELFYRKTSDKIDVATPLESGVRVEPIDSDFDFDNMSCIRVAKPYPATILALEPRMDTQDAE